MSTTMIDQKRACRVARGLVADIDQGDIVAWGTISYFLGWSQPRFLKTQGNGDSTGGIPQGTEKKIILDLEMELNYPNGNQIKGGKK